MSQLNVDNIQNRTGSNGGPNFPSGITVAVGQTAYIHGNLQVDGTETIVNTETLNVADKTVGIGSTSNASNTTADGAGIEVFASHTQTGNNKTITWQNSSNAWTFGGGGIVATDSVVGSAVTINSSGIDVTGVVTATSFKGDGSLLTGIDATQIQKGNTSVQTVDTGSDGHVKMTTEGGERVRIGPAGQIGLGGANYGTSGQLLTSAGSGSAPTWTTVSSAPEVSGTANGTIAAGKPVIANADGSIAEVKYTYTEKGTYVDSTAQTGNGGLGDAQQMRVGYDSTHDKFIYFAYYTQQNSQAYIVYGTPNATTGLISSYGAWSNIENISTTQTGDIVWSKTSAIGAAIYRTASGIFVRAFNLPSGTTYQFGNKLNICANGASDYTAMTWDESSDKFLVVVGDNAANSNYAEAYVISHSGTTLTKGTAVTVKTSKAKDADLAYDSDNNRHLLTYADEADSDKLCGRIITVSGTVPTVNAETKESTTNYEALSSSYVGDGKFLCMYDRADPYYGRVVTISGTTVTFGTESAQMDTGGGSTLNGKMLDTAYDVGTEKVAVFYNTSTYGFWQRATVNKSNNTVTFANRTQLNGQTSGGGVAYSKHYMTLSFGMINGTTGVMWMYRNYITSTNATNITGENYLGVANASYTNGQTVSIRVSGATQDSQSGLTPGQNYFVQNDGTLGTTAASPTVYAGTAVSSTKLLVGKESDSPSASWLKLASFDGSQSSSGTQVIYEDFANQTYRRYKLVFYARSTSSGSGNVDLGLQIKGSSGSWQTSNYRMMEVNFRDTNQNQHITVENKLRISRTSAFLVDGEYLFYDPADLDNNSPTEHMFGMTNYAQHSAQPGSNADCYQYNIANGGWQSDGNQYVAGIRWNFGDPIATFSWALFAANGWN